MVELRIQISCVNFEYLGFVVIVDLMLPIKTSLIL